MRFIMNGAVPLKNKKVKPKYNLFQNSVYMIRFAWEKRKGVLWLCLILAILAVLENLLSVLVTPVILSAVEDAVPIGQLFMTILLFGLTLMLVSTVNTYFDTKIPFEHASFRIILTSQISKKITTISYPLTEDQDIHKMLDRATMAVIDANSATQAIWITMTKLLTDSLGIVIYLFLLSSLDFWTIFLVFITSVIGFFLNRKMSGWGYRHREEEAEYSRHMKYVSNKAGKISIVKDIRMFGMNNWLEDVYRSNMHLLRSFISRREKVYIWGDIINAVLTFARNGIANIYLIGLVRNGGISASRFLLCFTAVGGFAVWVNGILSGFIDLYGHSLEITTMREFLEYPETFIFEGGIPLEPDVNKSYQIKLKNVSFRYPKAERDTLKNINLTIQPGEKLAIVGLNGAGKTTLVKLICGFFDPTEGEILLNEENIKKYNRRDYYRHFSAVFQDFSILPVTLAENISQTELIDMEKMRNCVEKAVLFEKIESLPQKYDTHLGKEIFEDGIEFSGGETQSLMLARALYKNAPVIILDEPTAALDPIAESEMYHKYHDLTDGRTSVYISHRLASTRFCDRIVLVGDGGILEEGTHDSLIQQGGKYAELFEIQSYYYQDKEY